MHRVAAARALVLVLVLVHDARAQTPPASPPLAPAPGHFTLAEARFRDACLDDWKSAEALYRKAIDQGLAPAEEAEAQYGIARARILAGRRDPGIATLEKLAEKIGDPTLKPWPARARRALDKLFEGGDPYERRPRGEDIYSLEATAKPVDAVLRDVMAKTGIGAALDEKVPARWLVTVSVAEVPFVELMNKVVGSGMWRRVGDGVAVGEIAGDGVAFERRTPWESLERREERALAGILATRRVSLNFPGIPLAKALDLLDDVAGVPIELDRAVAEGRTRSVRLFVKDARMDDVLDLFAVPIGLEWRIDGARVVLRERRSTE